MAHILRRVGIRRHKEEPKVTVSRNITLGEEGRWGMALQACKNNPAGMRQNAQAGRTYAAYNSTHRVTEQCHGNSNTRSVFRFPAVAYPEQ
jgi:hypothetical protein